MWLNRAISLQEEMFTLFYDSEEGGFFMLALDQTSWLERQKQGFGGSLPSANSVAAFNLARLAKITANQKWEKVTLQIATLFYHDMLKIPIGYTTLLKAVDFAREASPIILMIRSEDSAYQKNSQFLYSHYMPRTIRINMQPEVIYTKKETIPIFKLIKFSAGLQGVIVCQKNFCSSPTNHLGTIQALLSDSLVIPAKNVFPLPSKQIQE